MYLLARARHRVERPHQLAGAHVPRAHVAGRPARRVLLRRPAGDDQVPVDDGRRAQAVASGQSAQDLRRVEADDALRRRTRRWAAGLGVQRVELGVARAEHDLRRRAPVARPVFNATRRRVAGGQLECPDLLARRRVERDDAVVRRGQVHDAVDDERRDFARGEAGAAAPAAAACGAGVAASPVAAVAGACASPASCDRSTRLRGGRRWRA